MGLFSIIGAAVGAVFPPAAPVAMAVGAAIDAKQASNQARRASNQARRASNQALVNMRTIAAQSYQKQMNLVQSSAALQKEFIQANRDRLLSMLEDEQTNIEDLVNNNYDELKQLTEATYYETLQNNENNFASARAAIEDSKSVEFAKQQQQKFEQIYGPIESKLADFYSNLDANEMANLQISDLRANLQQVKNSIDKSMALRGLNFSALAIKAKTDLEYKAALQEAKIREESKYKVAGMQQDFYKLGLSQNTAGRLQSELSKQNQQIFNLERQKLDILNKLESDKANQLVNLGLQKSENLQNIEQRYSGARLSTEQNYLQQKQQNMQNLFNEERNIEQNYSGQLMAIEGGQFKEASQLAREERERQRQLEQSMGESLAKIVVAGIDKYNQNKEGSS